MNALKETLAKKLCKASMLLVEKETWMKEDGFSHTKD